VSVSEEDPQQTVQTFIDLIERHEQSFYYFVHKVHSKGEGLFSGLMRWIELFLDIVREGLGQPISLEFILPHTGDERREIMKEIDEVALYHYKLKVAYETKLRRRFGRAGGTDINNGEDEGTREIVNGFVRDVSFGDLMRGDMLDMAAEEEESDDSYELTSEYESVTDDDETGSEESKEILSTPPALSRVSPPTPSVPGSISQPVQLPFPRSQPSEVAIPPRTKLPSTSPAPSVTTPTSTGGRLRRLSLTLRKSRSMTFGSARASSSSNSADPPPPVPPLPQSITPFPSTAPLTGRSKPLPPQPSSPSSTRTSFSLKRRVSASTPATLHPHTTPAQKRYPASPNLPQTPTKPNQNPKQTPEGLKPPELKKLPELLPIFVEMVRHCLQPSLFFFCSFDFGFAFVAAVATHLLILILACRCDPPYVRVQWLEMELVAGN
jgi:hypothetical protein